MKRVHNIIILGVTFGGTLLLLRFIFGLSQKTVWKYYIITSVIILLGALIINITWQMKLMKRLKSLERILKDERNPDQFIEENKKILDGLKSEYNRNLIKINLSAGYCDKGDYDTAKNMLLSIKTKYLKGINEIVYYINLAYIYFRLEENQKALIILEQQNKNLVCFENNPHLGGLIAVLRINQYIIQGQLDEAHNLLDTARKKWTDNRLVDDWDILQNKVKLDG
jgi:hypothetical protein